MDRPTQNTMLRSSICLRSGGSSPAVISSRDRSQLRHEPASPNPIVRYLVDPFQPSTAARSTQPNGVILIFRIYYPPSTKRQTRREAGTQSYGPSDTEAAGLPNGGSRTTRIHTPGFAGTCRREKASEPRERPEARPRAPEGGTHREGKAHRWSPYCLSR